MKKTLTFITIFACFSALVSCDNKQEYTEGLKFTQIGDSYAVSVGEAINEKHIIIPSTYKKMPVTVIDKYGFSGCGHLEKIEIPESIVKIDKYAFQYTTNLKEINLPNSLEVIEERAFFSSANFDTFVFPENLKSVDGNIFSSTFVEQLIIKDANSFEHLDSDAFDSCRYVFIEKNQFDIIKIGPLGFSFGKVSKIFYDVTSYNNYSDDKTYRYFTIGQSEKNLYNEGAVINGVYVNDENKGCITLISEIDGHIITGYNSHVSFGLIAIKIPEGMDKSLYYNNIFFDIDTSYIKIFFDGELPNPAFNYSIGHCDEFGIFGDYLWMTKDNEEGLCIVSYYSYEEETLTIPSYINDRKVTEIADLCFFKKEFKKVVLPEHLLKLGGVAFSNCKHLEEIEFNDKLELIGAGVFSNCGKLTHVTLPNSLKEIGDGAFLGCSSLNSVILNQGLTIIGDKAFYECNELVSIMIPESVTTIGAYAFSRGEKVKDNGEGYVPSYVKYPTLYFKSNVLPENLSSTWNVIYSTYSYENFKRVHAYIPQTNIILGYTEN